jgi:hypothetical protein
VLFCCGKEHFCDKCINERQVISVGCDNAKTVDDAIEAALQNSEHCFVCENAGIVPEHVRRMILNTEEEEELAARSVEAIDVDELAPQDVKFLSVLAGVIRLGAY